MKFFLKNLLALVVGLGACAGGWYMGKSSMTKLFSWTDDVGQIQEYTTGNSGKRTNPRVAFEYVCKRSLKKYNHCNEDSRPGSI